MAEWTQEDSPRWPIVNRSSKKFVFNPTGFSCDLKREKCTAMTQKGKQCRRFTVIGLGYCWSHMRTVKNLKVQKSQIPNAGNGLFAHSPGSIKEKRNPIFKRGKKITDYNGEKITIESLNRRYDIGSKTYTAPYGLSTKTGHAEDGACQRGIGTLPNTNRGKNNATLKYARNTDQSYIEATKGIYHNDEIFLSYGRAYRFETVRGKSPHKTSRSYKKRG